MKKALIVVGVGVAVWVLYRVATAAAAGAPITRAVVASRVPVEVLAASAAAERKVNTGSGHF